MKTVKQLIDDLSKFPADSLCRCIEREVVGIEVVEDGEKGFIHCSTIEDPEPTEFFK